jgi:signal transduction histidine kinase
MQRVNGLVDRAVRWLIRPRTAARRYLSAGALAVGAGVLTFAVPFLLERPVFVAFSAAIALATLYGGLGPGLFAIAVSTACAYAALRRAPSVPDDPHGIGTLAAFAGFALLLVLLAHLMRSFADQARRREDQLGRSLALVKGWAWEYDFATGRVTRTIEGTSRLSRLNLELAATREAWRKAVHPDDLPHVQQLFEDAVRSGRDEYRSEYRVQLGGETFWVEDVVRIERGPDGRPARVVGLALDATERRRMTDELVRTSEALRAADRRKDEFLAMLAHELRNPLAPIRTAATLLQRLAPPDERLRMPIAIVHRQVAHLARIVDDLLDVSRITHDRIELRRLPLRLDEVVAEACEAVQPLLAEKGHALRTVADEAWVRGDRARLVQVATNLLTNAAKYTPEGGHVEIRAWREGSAACLSVVDDGSGITAELLPHVFELFVQGRQTIDRAKGGLGLGLSLVKRLVEMHGGTVAAHSAGPGTGATFTVRLPAIEAPAPTAETTRPAASDAP